MATIPAPNIVESAEQISQNPLTEYSRAVQIQGEQQQVKQARIQTQVQQQQLQDQQAMTKAMQSWDGQDINQLPDLMRKNGISGSGYMNAQQAILARRQQLQTLDKGQLENMQAHHDAALGVINAAEQVPDEQLSQHMTDSATNLAKQGHLSPQEAQAVIQHAQSTPPAEFRPWLDVYKKGLQAESTQISQAKSKAETDEAAAKAAAAPVEAAAETQKANAETQKANAADWKDFPELGVSLNTRTKEQIPIAGAGGMMPPGMMEAKYVALQQKKNAGQSLSKDDSAWVKGYEKFKTLVPVTNLNMQAGLLNDQAKQMAGNLYQQTGQLPPGMRSPAMAAQILNKAAGAPEGVPDIASAKRDYAASTAVEKNATSGAVGQQLLAIGTAREHMKTFGQIAEALDNGDVQALNKLGNAFGVQFGSDKATNFKIAAQAFGGEIGKALDGARATAGEREQAQDAFNAAMSNGQFKGAIRTVDALLAGKQKAAHDWFDQGMSGKPNFGSQAGAAAPGGNSGRRVIDFTK